MAISETPRRSESPFMSQAGWLERVYREMDPGEAVRARVAAALELAGRAAMEVNSVGDFLESEEYGALRERAVKLRGNDVSEGEITCMDGRIGRLFWSLPRMLSRFSTAGGLIEVRNNGIADALGSSQLVVGI